jgi:hypothetical protein
LYLERKRGLDEESLRALKASDTYWNERTYHDYGQAAEELRQQGKADITICAYYALY